LPTPKTLENLSPYLGIITNRSLLNRVEIGGTLQKMSVIPKDKIYFQLRCSTIKEEYGLCFERGNDTPYSDAPSFTNPLYNHRPGNKLRMQAVVTAFVSRLLTPPADLLNAFAGISNVLNFLPKERVPLQSKATHPRTSRANIIYHIHCAWVGKNSL
jgi:hypothetical protein